MVLNVIPKSTLKHEVFSSINPVIRQISKLECKVPHFYRSLIEQLGILGVPHVKQTEEPDRNTHDHKVNNQKEVNEG